MKNEEKILELLTESLKRQDRMEANQQIMRSEMDKRFVSLENQQATTNLEIKEIRFSIDRLVKYLDHLLPQETRVAALEKKGLKKS